MSVRSEAMLWRTVKAGFALRRKTLVNSLQTGFSLSKPDLARILNDCGLAADIRGERLDLQEYARLSDALFEIFDREG